MSDPIVTKNDGELPISRKVRERMSLGHCRQDGKFYPRPYEQRLLDDVAALERDSIELKQMKKYMGSAYPTFRSALQRLSVNMDGGGTRTGSAMTFPPG